MATEGRESGNKGEGGARGATRGARAPPPPPGGPLAVGGKRRVAGGGGACPRGDVTRRGAWPEGRRGVYSSRQPPRGASRDPGERGWGGVYGFYRVRRRFGFYGGYRGVGGRTKHVGVIGSIGGTGRGGAIKGVYRGLCRGFWGA